MKVKNVGAWALALGIGLGLGAVPALPAAEGKALGAEELRAARQRLEADAAFARAAATRADDRLVLVGATRYRAADDEKELVELLYFKYEGGVTVRAALDPRTGRVVEVESLKAFPAPLADEEYAEAVRLAREQNGPVRDLVARQRGPALGVHVVPVVISDPNDPRYGHRIVLVTHYVKAGGGPSILVEVDLTQKILRPFRKG